MPKDSPPSDGAHSTCGAAPAATPARRRRRGPATPRGRSAAMAAPQPLGVGALPRHPQRGSRRRRARSAPKASSRTPRPLRSSWRPTKSTVGPVGRPRVGAGRTGRARPRCRRSRTCPPSASPAVARASGDTAQRAVSRPAGPPRQRDRAAGRRRWPRRGGRSRPWAAGTQQAGVAGPRGQRLVQVHDVEAAVARRRARPAPAATGPRETGATEPLAGSRHRPAQRHDAARRRGPGTSTAPSRRRQHHGLVPGAGQGAGQPEHLALDAAGPAQAVGAQQGDAHGRPVRPRRRAVDRRRGAPWPRWSLGQLGWKRCHCSGARRISCSRSWAISWVTRATSCAQAPGALGRDGAMITAVCSRPGPL